MRMDFILEDFTLERLLLSLKNCEPIRGDTALVGASKKQHRHCLESQAIHSTQR